MHAHRDPQESVDIFQLFASQGKRDIVEPKPAIPLRDHDAEQSKLPHLVENFSMKLALCIPLLNVGATSDELAHHIANLKLLVGEIEIHRSVLDFHERGGAPPARSGQNANQRL